jgi:hypothetical protein
LSETKRLVEAQELGGFLADGRVTLRAVIDRLLQKTNGTDRLLLVVDQFEELFTLASDVCRLGFVNALLDAQRRSPLTVVLTLRADFYGHAIGVSRDLSDHLDNRLRTDFSHGLCASPDLRKAERIHASAQH